MPSFRIPAKLCVRCKTHRRLCGLPRCPIIERFRAVVKSVVKIKDNRVEGSTPPSFVVGEYGYPKVSIYLGIPPEIRGYEASLYDNPKEWWGRASLLDILKLRASMIHARLRVPIPKPEYLYEKEISLAAISEKPVDAEAKLKSLPKPRLSIKDMIPPIGPVATTNSLKIVDNPKLHRKLEQIIWDDVKAQEALWELYNSGVSIYIIQRALSAGLIGSKIRRRIVPTRWAITATDTTISRYLLREVNSCNEITESKIFFKSYLGNRFWIIMFPGPYRFDWIEIWHPVTVFTREASKPIIIYNYENWRGKARYLDGGYQAARLSVLEYLSSIKRKAHVIVVREITPEYYASVGNWHIRETVRNALASGGRSFTSIDELLSIIRHRSKYVAEIVHEHLDKLSKQRILDEFI
ncbi:MAG: hypothetical protein DRO15_06820 [Thermoprotei archaeon]|nr:MAG: hypothetical protein DRO15_06820 [Thermoprotei archaeon]